MSETRAAQDAQWEKMYGTEPHHVEEAWDFALKMEQERDEARKWCNIHWEGVRSTGKHCADVMNELQKITEQRDEARRISEWYRDNYAYRARGESDPQPINPLPWEK